MTVITPIAINEIVNSFTDLAKGPIGKDDLYADIYHSKNSNDATDGLAVCIILYRYHVSDVLLSKVVAAPGPHSKIQARLSLIARYKDYSLSSDTGKYEAKNGELEIGGMTDVNFELLETVTEGRATDDKDFNPVKLTAEQAWVIAGHVIVSFSEEEKQQILDAALVSLNDNRMEGFCTTFDERH